MCGLSYFPTTTGYILTHNRDEHFLRENALPPEYSEYNNRKILFPKDGRAGGSWIACFETISVCLLNGAFVKHQHSPPYRLSRGIVLLDIFSFHSLKEFEVNYDLTGIEPFTVVRAEGDQKLEELRWDGISKYYTSLPLEPAFWSSATLYNEEARKKRELIFQKFLENHSIPKAGNIFHFHHSGKVGSAEQDLVMERANGVKTLSISQVICEASQLRFRYDDLLNGKTYAI